MAGREADFLLVGGFAAAHCATELRRRGAEGTILLAGREPEPPYERPPLSKEYLRGDSSRADAYVHDPGWYEENEVELLSGRSVLSLDAEARTAKIQGGEEVAFGKALLATGAMVNILRVDGAQLEGIHYLRAFGNADSIRDDLEGREHVVLIGGSYIAAEVAASLVEMGKRCSMVMIEDVPLSSGFGERAGRWFQEQLESRGVDVHGGETLAAFEGDERVGKVLTESGLEIECDAVVVGAGVRPDTMLAGRAGIEVGEGIVCDAGLETSVPGIFAAGDCASFDSELHGRRARVEHWDVAMQQGRHAARGMLGDKRPYRVVPYFFSDLSDWAAIEYVGIGSSGGDEVFRGDPADGAFSVWYLDGGRVTGALSVGRSEDLIEARRMVEERTALTDARVLADLGTDLSQLA
jgi:3-phenylpropionate/trans-cinnamate dioxygenase ferredoxin reductase subunit